MTSWCGPIRTLYLTRQSTACTAILATSTINTAFRFAWRVLVVLALSVLIPADYLRAQDAETPEPAAQTLAADDSSAVEDLRQLRERLNRVEKDLERIQQQKPAEIPKDPADQRVLLVLELPYLGSSNYGTATRFLAGKLLLINLTPQPLTIKRDDVRLDVDGQPHALQDVPAHLRFHTYQVGQQQLVMRSLSPLKEVRVPVGGTAGAWLFFSDLPAGSSIPKLKLMVQVGGKPQSLDINAAQRDQLGLTVERIGPRGCLGLLTISGELNTVNAGSILEELDRLSAQKIGRAVISWAEGSPTVDPYIAEWLQTAAASAGKPETGQTRFPSIPATLRELHLAALPGQTHDDESLSDDEDNPASAIPRSHKTVAIAVRMALRSAYETLPREELLQAIGTGNRLSRAAALAHGAGRLPPDNLPLVLKYADDHDPFLQEAALTALQHFGDPEAIAKLVHYTRKNVEPLASRAVASLAGSRFAAAHQALLDVLQNETPESKKTIVTVLAQYPRPFWADAIYAFVKDPRSGLNLEALRALQLVGHPELVTVLKDALHGGDAQLKQQAFAILVARTDSESEQIALNYTLEWLKTSPPDTLMLTLLGRVKDERAVPLLMAQLDKATDKSSLIQTLSQIGNQEVVNALLEKYSGLQSHDKAQVLNALHRWKSPRFRELAKEALLSTDSSLINAAAQGLIEDGGAEAVQLLVEALEKSSQPQSWNYICNALGMLGTQPARAALLKARDAGSAEKRNYAVNALTAMRQRSPAYQYVLAALENAQNKKYKESVNNYNTAIQMDPDLPEAYTGRAECYIRQDKFTEAGKDYAKALELDPFSSQALSGYCVVLAIDGKYADAIGRLEKSRDKFPNDPLFAYNSACVYGRAVEHLQSHTEIEDRDKLSTQYTASAVADLKRSIKLGFRDLDWMKQDPDLKSLHGVADFQKLGVPSEDAEGPAGEADNGLGNENEE